MFIQWHMIHFVISTEAKRSGEIPLGIPRPLATLRINRNGNERDFSTHAASSGARSK